MAFYLISYHGNAHQNHNTMLFYVLLNDQNEEEMVAHSGKSVEPTKFVKDKQKPPYRKSI